MNLKAVLTRLKEYEVMLNEDKLEISKKEVKFVGHLISAEHVFGKLHSRLGYEGDSVKKAHR
jgi:hypothetical protein